MSKKHNSKNSKYSYVNEFNMPAPRWIRTYPAGPYRFINREFLIITYETEPRSVASYFATWM